MRRSALVLCLILGGGWLHGQSDSRVSMLRVEASSTLPPGKTVDYRASHIVDGSLLSWSEGSPGPGIGETIDVAFDGPITLRYVTIKNGYGDLKYWQANNRVKTLQVIARGSGDTRTLHLEDTPEFRSYSLIPISGNAGDAARLGYPRDSAFVFRIVDVYPGDSWDDTCIAEIGFNTAWFEEMKTDSVLLRQHLWAEFLHGTTEGGRVYAVGGGAHEPTFGPVSIEKGVFVQRFRGQGDSRTVSSRMYSDLESNRHIIAIETTTEYSAPPPNTYSALELSLRTDERTGWVREYTQSDLESFFEYDPFRIERMNTGDSRRGFWDVSEPEEITFEVRDLKNGGVLLSVTFTWNGKRFVIIGPVPLP